METHHTHTSTLFGQYGPTYPEFPATPADSPAATGEPLTLVLPCGEVVYGGEPEPAELIAIEIGLDDAAGNADTPIEIDPIATPARGKKRRKLRHVWEYNATADLEFALSEAGILVNIVEYEGYKRCYLRGNPVGVGNLLTEKNLLYVHSTNYSLLPKGKCTAYDWLKVRTGELAPLVAQGAMHRDRIAALIYCEILSEVYRVGHIRLQHIPELLRKKRGIRQSYRQVRHRVAWLVEHGLLVRKSKGVYGPNPEKIVTLIPDPYEIPLVFSKGVRLEGGGWATVQYVILLGPGNTVLKHREITSKHEQAPNAWTAFLEYLTDPTLQSHVRFWNCAEAGRDALYRRATCGQSRQAPKLRQPSTADYTPVALARIEQSSNGSARTNGGDSMQHISEVFAKSNSKAVKALGANMRAQVSAVHAVQDDGQGRADGLQSRGSPPDGPEAQAQDDGRASGLQAGAGNPPDSPDGGGQSGVQVSSPAANSNPPDSPDGGEQDSGWARAWARAQARARARAQARALQADDAPPDSPQDAAQDEGRQKLRRICANLLAMAAEQEAQRAQGATPTVHDRASGSEAGAGGRPDP